MDRTTRRRGSRARHGLERGAAPSVLVVVLGLVSGAVAGLVLERAGMVDPLGEPAPAVVRIDRIGAFDCPDGILVASLARGDRVLVTARSDDGTWFEIRSPVDLEGRLWVSSDAVEGDDGGAVLRLPERACGERPSTTTSTSTTSTSTTSTSTTTSTTSTTTTSTTIAPTTSTSTTTPNAPPEVRLVVTGSISGQPPASTTSSTTTTPPPSTSSTTLPPGSFFYVHALPSPCNHDASAVVDVVDPDGVAAVHLRWDTGPGGATGQQPMVQVAGSTTQWALTVQFPLASVPVAEQFRSPIFTVIATDGRGVETAVTAVPVSAFRVFGADEACAQ